MTRMARIISGRKVVPLLCVAVIGYGLIYIIQNQLVHDSNKKPITNHLKIYSTGEQACIHPKLDLMAKDIVKYLEDIPPPQCSTEPEWVIVKGSVASINPAAQKIHGMIECTFTDILRATDDLNRNGISTTTYVDYEFKNSDAARVKCKASDNANWKSVITGIRSDPLILEQTTWKKTPEDGLKLNVLMFGFDSVSRLHFMRKLPKSYQYLTHSLDAIVLKGYNIVGDGTPQALIPILTGKTELELPETRKRMGRKATYVNAYPFIWNDFQKYGYTTAYFEDCSSIATFSYRLKGFNKQPTIHFMRPYYLTVYPEYRNHVKFCYHATPEHKTFMDEIVHLYEVYKDKPKFIFAFHGELSHDNINNLGIADDDLLDMLSGLNESGDLNNTLLVTMSDHGNRFAKIRESQQGKQEERLPFFSFAFPPWFKIKYPEAYKNFRKNADRLSTPFDIHRTLMNVLHYEGAGIGDVRNRSLSLFKEVPLERTCEDADIEPHWCACLKWEQLSLLDPKAQRAAIFALGILNDFTALERDQCAILTLKTVSWAAKMVPDEGLLTFKQNADVDGFVPDLTDNTQISEELYQVHLITLPGEGRFEVSLKYNVGDDAFSMKMSDVSRANKYGSQAHCIDQTNHDLRKYCYCKKPPPS